MSDQVDLVIKTKLDAADTKQAGDKLKQDAKKIGEEAGRNLEAGFTQSANRIRSSFSSVTIAIASAAAALAGVTATIYKGVEAANIQDTAVNRLNASLALSGKFSKQASQDLQEFAASLQNTTKFGDELILKNAALIQSLGRLDTDGLKRATTAATNLASALGISLEQASSIVGRAAAGNTSALARLGIEIKEGADKAETFANVLAALEQRFGGAAQAQVQTFAGALAQAKNAFGDLLEEVGFFVTRSPLVRFAIVEIKNALVFVSEAISDVRKNTTQNFKVIGDSIFEFAKNVNRIFVGFGEIVVNTFQLVFRVATTAVSGIVAAFGQLGGFVGSIIQKITGGTSSIGQSLVDFSQTSLAVANAEFAKLDSAAANLFSLETTNAIDAGISTVEARFQAFAQNAALTSEEFRNNVSEPIVESLGEIEGKGDQVAQQLNQTLNQNLVRGISGGIQNIVQSLANGENAFENFGKFVLNTAGDLAIQLGQVLIGAGVGIESLKSLGGAAAIAAGAGLVAIGAVLKSLAGGGGNTTSKTSTGGSNFSPLEPATNVGELSDPQGEKRQERASVNLTIQGDVFDSDESGLRIAKLVNQAAGKTGIVFRNTRTV